MGEWTRCSLGDIAELKFGRTPPRSESRFWNQSEGYLWATIADMRIDPILATAETISEAGLPFAGRTVPAGSVMMSFKLTVGRVARAGVELLTNEAIVSVHSLDGKADDGWLYHALPGIALGGVTDTAVKGATLNKSKLKRLIVDLPALEEQRRIAEVLDTIDETIQATERVISKLDLSGRALLSRLVLQNPMSRESVALNSTGTWLSGGTPSTDESAFWGGPIPWISASSLRKKYLLHSNRTLTPSGAMSGSRLVPPGTLICVVRGMSLKSEFRVGIAQVELAFGQDCKALSPGKNWLPEYLYLQLIARESEILKMVDEASHGTGRLQMSLLGALSVDFVPLPEQERLVSIFQAHEQRVVSEQLALMKLRQTRAGIAADLLSGRVRTVAA